MEPTHKQKKVNHEASADIRPPLVQECPKDLRRLVKAIDHQWAYTFFLSGYVTPANGPVRRLRTQEKVVFIEHLWHEVENQWYCRFDTGKLYDYLIRLSVLAQYIEALPNDEFYRENVHLTTARNGFASMIHFATAPHVNYDEDKPFCQSDYEEDDEVKHKQRVLYYLFGGRERWERIRKMHRIFWPKAEKHPCLLSSEQLGFDDDSKET